MFVRDSISWAPIASNPSFAEKPTYATLTPEQVRGSSSSDSFGHDGPFQKPGHRDRSGFLPGDHGGGIEKGWLLGPVQLTDLDPSAVVSG